MVGESFDKLSGIQQDIQNGWQAYVDEVANSYEIDKLDEEDLRSLMASFGILDLYSSLPPYYLGSLVNEDGDQYLSPLPGGRMPFMRDFTREMLRMRTQAGLVRMFDSIMGLLRVPTGKFTVLQNFRYGDSLDPNPEHVQSEAHPEYDTILERVIYSDAHIQGLYEPAPCYRKYGLLAYDAISNPIPGKIDEMPYDPMPLTHRAFFPDITGKRLTPTQTVTVDVLTAIDAGIQTDFIKAVRLIVNFLKPTFVVFKDIVPTAYLFMDTFYQMSMSLKGSFVNPQPGAPDFRIDLYTDATADAGTNRYNFSSLNPVAAGLRPGMLLTVTGFSSGANNVTLAQITAIGNTYIEMNTATVFLVNGTATARFYADYDHSFQEALTVFDVNITKTGVFSVSALNKISRNDAVPGVTGFDVDGFSKGKLLLVSGFSNDANNIKQVKQAIISQVANNYLLLSYTGLAIEPVAGQTVTIKMIDSFDVAVIDSFDELSIPKPFIEERSDTMHPVLHQPGPVPTLDSGGSYNRQSATERLDVLDATHYNNLGARIGGMIWFGNVYPPSDFSVWVVTDGLGDDLLITDGFGD